MNRIGIMALGLLSLVGLASCGTVAVQSERDRGITNEQEQSQISESISKDKAERAAKAEASKQEHIRAYTERHGFPPKD